MKKVNEGGMSLVYYVLYYGCSFCKIQNIIDFPLLSAYLALGGLGLNCLQRGEKRVVSEDSENGG